MAIDYLIGTLIAASTLVNALALGAFWVTPGLRTTANRFVINLLIVNLVGCAALTPSLFGSWSASSASSSHIGDHHHHNPFHGNDGAGPVILQPQLPQSAVNDSTTTTTTTTSSLVDLALADVLAVERAVDLVSEATAAGVVDAMEVVASIAADAGRIDDNDDEEETEEDNNGVDEVRWQLVDEEQHKQEQEQPTIEEAAVFWGNTRHWGFDLTAALGALSVLLIVGDTWCAVTDPLRYHARISAPKAWIAIALTWSLSIAFGIASAFRTTVTSMASPPDMPSTSSPPTSSSWPVLYDFCFATAYFVLIILMPIGAVCGMYWKIVTEAKQNGLRMRQNGSSPLLQSALNLAAASTTTVVQQPTLRPVSSSGGGLIMNIDQRNSHRLLENERGEAEEDSEDAPDANNVQPLLTSSSSPPPPPPSRRYLEIPPVMGAPVPADKNHNSLLAVPIATLSAGQQTPRGANLTRNLSTRHLLLVDQKHQPSVHIAPAAKEGTPQPPPSSVVPMRHVRSTPNLQKTDGAHHAVAMHTLHHHLHTQHHHHHQSQHHHLHHHHMQHPSSSHQLNHHHQHQHNHQHHHQHHHHQHHHHPHHALNAVTVHVPSKALCYMSSIRHRLSNASSIFKYREESRAARISVLVVVMCLVSYLPYGLLVLCEGVHSSAWKVPNAQLLAVLCVMVSNIGSPFIFAYRNKRVRRGVCRLFGLDAKTNERMQKRQLSIRRPSAAPSAAPLRVSAGSRTSMMMMMDENAGRTSTTSAGIPAVTVSINGPEEAAVTAPGAAASQPPRRSTTGDDLAAIRQKLSVLRRVYMSTRKLSCTGSTCTGSDTTTTASSGRSSSSSSSSSSSRSSNGSHSSRSGSSCYNTGGTGADGGGESGGIESESRRQSSDV